MLLQDVCECIVDCPHFTAPDEGVGYPLIRTPNVGKGRLVLDGVHRVSEEIYNRRNLRAVPQDDDLIFTREAPAGNVAIIKNGEKVCLGQRTVLLRPNKTVVNPDFLVYYLLAPQQQYGLLGSANGATVTHINIPIIKKLPIHLPHLQIQNKIADILSSYDDLIENNQKQIVLLEEAAQRLYKEWFVDLRFPGHEKTPIVDGVPEGWSLSRITDLLDVCYGKDHKTLADGMIPVYGSGGIMRKVSSVLCSGESVLIPRKGSLNNILYVSGDFWTIDTMFYTIPKRNNIAKFIYLFLCTLDMYSFNIGAAVPSMTVNILAGISVLFPTNKVLCEFENVLRPIFNKVEVLRKQEENAKEARDRLLPKLMGGELEVEEK